MQSEWGYRKKRREEELMARARGCVRTEHVRFLAKQKAMVSTTGS